MSAHLDRSPDRADRLLPDQSALLAAAAAAVDQPRALLQAVDTVGRQATGHSLFTAMLFDQASMTVQRIFTSDDQAYPLGGRKPKRDTAWGRHVLIEHRVFVGEDAGAIRAAFDDHALILGLGLRAVVNIPVVIAGRCRGTLNFLWDRALRPDDIAVARRLAGAASAAFEPGSRAVG